MRDAVILDVRNVFVPEATAAAGFVYLGRDRGPKGSVSMFAAFGTAMSR